MTDGRERQRENGCEWDTNKTKWAKNQKREFVSVTCVTLSVWVSVLLLYFASLCFAFLVYFLTFFFIVYLSSAFCLVWFHWHQAPVYLGAVLVHTHTSHNTIIYNINRIQNNTTNAGALFLFVFICVSVSFSLLSYSLAFFPTPNSTMGKNGQQQ